MIHFTYLQSNKSLALDTLIKKYNFYLNNLIERQKSMEFVFFLPFVKNSSLQFQCFPNEKKTFF